MNYRPLINEKLEEFEKELPDYTFCETIVSILTVLFKGQPLSKGVILEITDEQVYTAASKALNIEKE